MIFALVMKSGEAGRLVELNMLIGETLLTTSSDPIHTSCPLMSPVSCSPYDPIDTYPAAPIWKLSYVGCIVELTLPFSETIYPPTLSESGSRKRELLPGYAA